MDVNSSKQGRQQSTNVPHFGLARLALAKLLVIAVAALSVSGCGEESQVQTLAQHAWINPPVTLDDKAVTLPAWLIYRVHDNILAETIETLKLESYIQLSPNMASYYTNTEVRVPPEMRPFLVRGVARDNTEIIAVQSNAGLWIKAVARPGESASGAFRPAPVVVLLDPTPEQIFVTSD